MYEYLTVMFQLGLSARIFTKITVAVITFLRNKFGKLIVTYMTTS